MRNWMFGLVAVAVAGILAEPASAQLFSRLRGQRTTNNNTQPVVRMQAPVTSETTTTNGVTRIPTTPTTNEVQQAQFNETTPTPRVQPTQGTETTPTTQPQTQPQNRQGFLSRLRNRAGR